VTEVPERLELDPDSVGQGLGRLVLTLVELIRQLMERQALRRVEAGDLPDEKVEQLGLGLMRLEEAMTELRASTSAFGPRTSISTSARSGTCCRASRTGDHA
jgi:hypothetical protein